MTQLKTTVLLVTLIIPTMTLAASLSVKTGAWETTTTTSMGQSNLPADMLAKIPPQMRAQFEAQIKANQKPHIGKGCITQDDLNQNKMLDTPDESTCTRKIISSSPKKMTMQRICAAPRESNSVITVEAISSEMTKGTIDISQPKAGKIHIDIKSRWLSSSCAGIPPRTDWKAKMDAARQHTSK